MSPLWRDEVAIYITPRKIALARRSRGLKPRVESATEIAVPGQSGDFGPTLATLADVLTESTWQAAAARVIVANVWVRYGILSWPSTRLDSEGRISQARYVLAESYGDGVSGWSVSLADTPPGQPSVACAMPAPLKAGLEDTLAGAHLPLRSLQSQLIVAFNASRHLLPADDAWFVSLDEGSLAAVHLSNGHWDRVHMARLSEYHTLATLGIPMTVVGYNARLLRDWGYDSCRSDRSTECDWLSWLLPGLPYRRHDRNHSRGAYP